MTDHVTGGTVDIVERLRKPRGGPLTGEWPGPAALELEAATEIERLRARLKDAETVYGVPAQQAQGCAHPVDDLRFGPRVPVRWGTALTQVCKCGAWRTMHHTPGRWQTTALPSTDGSAPEERTDGR